MLIKEEGKRHREDRQEEVTLQALRFCLYGIDLIR